MADFRMTLSSLALAAMLAVPAIAQDTGTATESDPATTETETETESPAAPAAPAAEAATADNGLSLGETVGDENAAGEPYIKESHGDWDVRCIRTEDGNDPCQLYQLLKNEEGIAVSEISMFALPEGQQAAAGATIAVPLETLLTQQLSLKIDTGEPKRYPFSWCSEAGCFSRVGFTDAEVASFKKGSKATLTIVPVVAPDQQVNLDISLSGFTAGYDAVTAINNAE